MTWERVKGIENWPKAKRAICVHMSLLDAVPVLRDFLLMLEPSSQFRDRLIPTEAASCKDDTEELTAEVDDVTFS